jgi:hypothetical protein
MATLNYNISIENGFQSIPNVRATYIVLRSLAIAALFCID